MSKVVYIGMSGGVDSSVAAALLKEQGYNVVGVYMKNWSRDLPGLSCPWRDDYQDAKSVAVKLGIPFKLYDFETEYRQKVVDYMLREFKAGRTPNPDIMCNQEVKFKLFLNTALEDGADLIATGHYARIFGRKTENAKPETKKRTRQSELRVAKNIEKDQSYFLYRVTAQALSRSLFPIGTFKSKAEVRLLAKKLGLPTADKKDSQGICFVGKVGIKDFLLNELGAQETGAIINQAGQEIGQHDGAIYYTIGQRHGLSVGGGLPYYVTGKNMAKNQIYVTTDLSDGRLWRRQLALTDVHWINDGPLFLKQPTANSQQPTGNDNYPKLQLRTRYRAPLVNIKKLTRAENVLKIELENEAKAITPGQSAVFYSGERVLGGGIVA